MSVNSSYLRRIIISSICCFASLQTFSQSDATYPTRHVIWLTPLNASKINGLAVGLQAINFKGSLVINGINAEAGVISVFLLPYLIADALPSKTKPALEYPPTYIQKDKINGLGISMAGHAGFNVNGVALNGLISTYPKLKGVGVTGLFSIAGEFNGIVIAGVNNKAIKGRGLQIALFNQCDDLKGLQIGLWNRSGKRKLPFINWGT